MNKSIKFFSVIMLSSLLLIPSAIAYASNYLTSSFSSASNLECYFTGDTTIGKYAMNQWNNVSSNVSLSESTSASGYDILVDCNRLEATDSSLLGIAIMESDNGYHDFVFCIQYKTTLLNTDTKRKGTATHEVGHALSLADQNLAAFGNTIMKQGVKTYKTLNNYDKTTLKEFWGD